MRCVGTSTGLCCLGLVCMLPRLRDSMAPTATVPSPSTNSGKGAQKQWCVVLKWGEDRGEG